MTTNEISNEPTTPIVSVTLVAEQLLNMPPVDADSTITFGESQPSNWADRIDEEDLRPRFPKTAGAPRVRNHDTSTICVSSITKTKCPHGVRCTFVHKRPCFHGVTCTRLDPNHRVEFYHPRAYNDDLDRERVDDPSHRLRVAHQCKWTGCTAPSFVGSFGFLCYDHYSVVTEGTGKMRRHAVERRAVPPRA